MLEGLADRLGYLVGLQVAAAPPACRQSKVPRVWAGCGVWLAAVLQSVGLGRGGSEHSIALI